MSKIAPWPWEWDGPVWDYEPENEAPWLLDADGHPVLQGEIQCMEHHAHILAAAPELLAACKQSLATIKDLFATGSSCPNFIINKALEPIIKAIAAAEPPGAEGEKG